MPQFDHVKGRSVPPHIPNDEYSNEKIEFRGIVCDASKYDSSIINTKTLKSEEDSLIITDKFIEVISPDIIEKNMNLGFTMTLIGIAAYIITIVLNLHKKNEI